MKFIFDFLSEGISFEDAPTMQYANEPTDALIKCVASGQPVPSMSWYKGGRFRSIRTGMLLTMNQLKNGERISPIFYLVSIVLDWNFKFYYFFSAILRLNSDRLLVNDGGNHISRTNKNVSSHIIYKKNERARI